MVLWLSDNIIIEEKMIANALICMAEYDNRGIVDWDDIHHFQDAFFVLWMIGYDCFIIHNLI